ncbi:P1 family peptidase [Actinoalloteichus hymeniacidonis]|uniref:L-aminopeptidase/D-esterase n=1 Tax=Actinoalloteichus hymeniacidonis TaxID=340345 RepID=A0AAC9HNP1_9PSEU|nr:P1 family peptidase [Actinoalloteichus hymeniacidonis]AOS62121.1 L-aminopeptidase/D-esterase [Actinoalloteichus hymeniacidonis]MBB5909857.1 L-aminopeptidase/D-esterase-like protein [Actinoalloteichus hymeniacidonis]
MAADRPTGAQDAITDVEGLLVGQYGRDTEGWATGCSVVLAVDGAVGGVDVRGGGPGTRETDLLAPGAMVPQVQGICLSGGSAFGLAAADGVMRWLAERGHGFPVSAEPGRVVPIVPSAVLFDLDIGDWDSRPDAEFGYRACELAAADRPLEGSVGSGTGARAGRLKGGVGTASTVLPDGTTLGALVAVNPVGEVIDPATGLPWAGPAELAALGLQSPSPQDVASAPEATERGIGPLNTVIGVVATDADLTKTEANRLAAVAHDGIARAVRPAHSMFDGDTIFGLATGRRSLAEPARRMVALDGLVQAGAEVFARAVVRGVLAATSLAGVRSYRDRYPSALR